MTIGSNTPERPPWRRKTPEDLAADVRRCKRGRLNPRPPASVAATIAMLMAAIEAFESIHRSGWIDWLACLAVASGLFVLFFVPIYLLQVVGAIDLGPATEPRILICTRCFRIGLPSRVRACPCGGTMDDAALWTPARCPKCDYDLRGTPHSCPECGTKLRVEATT